jgi:hypothetical protein
MHSCIRVLRWDRLYLQNSQGGCDQNGAPFPPRDANLLAQADLRLTEDLPLRERIFFDRRSTGAANMAAAGTRKNDERRTAKNSRQIAASEVGQLQRANRLKFAPSSDIRERMTRRPYCNANSASQTRLLIS